MTYTRGGHKVARYDSAVSAYPSALEFSGEGDLPVHIHYEEPLAFAKGGLVKTANRIKKAGRYGDTEIVHVNKEELQELRELWGEPTINPQTGCPEYFLKKVWKSVKKIAKPIARIAPLAAMFIPGVGPLAAAAIGAASGGITGGLKGALVGGALGGIGGSGIVSKALGSVAPGLSPLAARAAQGALLGGVGSAAMGGNLLSGALTGGALGAAIGPGGLVNPQGTPMAPTGAANTPVNASISGVSDTPFTVNPGQGIVRPAFGVDSSVPLAVRPDVSQLTVTPSSNPTPWLKRPFLDGAISPKISNAVGYGGLGALALSSMAKPSSGTKVQDFRNAGAQELIDAKMQPIFSQKELPAPKSPIFSQLGVKPRQPRTLEEQYAYGQGPERAFFDYVQEPVYAARGGSIESFAVEGEGDGREDLIDAKLSDGEYVIDAETVALLGNGSSKAGAKALDAMRVNLRKHKGRNLARGSFSVKAKAPEKYMAVKHGR